MYVCEKHTSKYEAATNAVRATSPPARCNLTRMVAS